MTTAGPDGRRSPRASHSLPDQPLEEQGADLVEQAAEPLGRVEAVEQVGGELADQVIERTGAQRREPGLVAARLLALATPNGGDRLGIMSSENGMTIHLPPDLERFVHDEVLSGRYPSEDDVIREALERLRGRAAASTAGLGSIGAMRDDADLLEQVTRDIMEGRRTRTLRPTPDE